MDQPPTSEERMAEKQNCNQHDCECPRIEQEEDYKKCTGSRRRGLRKEDGKEGVLWTFACAKGFTGEERFS
jgi:hypothetical protein